MATSLTIEPARSELVRGEPVAVRVILHLDKPLKLRGVTARFHGAEETKATYTRTTSTGKTTTTTTHTAIEHMTVVEESHLLAGRPSAGFFKNMGDAVATLFGGGGNVVLPAGEHVYELDVGIPETAPATHTGDRSRVFYELSVRIDIPLGRDIKSLYAFYVTPEIVSPESNPVRVRYPDDEGRGFWDKLFGPDVRIELALAGDALALGESVDGVFQVETQKPLDVRVIRARLLAVENSQAHGHHDSARFQTDPIEVARPGQIEGTFAERFTISADKLSDMPLTARGTHFSIDWFVQVELEVPWARDPAIRAPVILLPAPSAAQP